MKNLWVKWTILVWVNAIIGLAFSTGFRWQETPTMFGIILGICVFIPIYVGIENKIRKNNQQELLKALNIAVGIRALLQLVVVVDMFAGMFALGFVQAILGNGVDSGFWYGLLATIFTGGLLSVIVAILTAIMKGILNLFKSNAIQKTDHMTTVDVPKVE